MRLFEKTLNPGGHDLAEVNQAAANLQGQACTLSARHISDGMLRLQFNREVAYFAQGVVKDVEAGIKTPEEGLKTIHKEQESFYDRSIAALKRTGGLIAGVAQMTTALMFCGKINKWVCGVTSTVLVSHGVNNTMENTRNLSEGRSDREGPVRLLYQETSLMLGGSRLQGNMAYGTVDMGLSAYGAFRMVPSPGAWRLWHYLDTDLVRGYQATSGLSLVIDAGGTAITLDSMYEEMKKNE